MASALEWYAVCDRACAFMVDPRPSRGRDATTAAMTLTGTTIVERVANVGARAHNTNAIE